MSLGYEGPDWGRHLQPSTTAPTWNGPICTSCGARYLGVHGCAPDSMRSALTYISCPTGASGPEVADRLARVDEMSEAEAKDILKRCIAMAAEAMS